MTRATRVSCVDSIVKMALPDPKTTPGELGTHTGTSAVIWWRNSALHWQLRRIQTGLENRSALTGTQECKKGGNCDNTRKTVWHQYGHLGTTDGTVFWAFLGKHRLGKPVHGGFSRGRWMTCALKNYPWSGRRLRVPALSDNSLVQLTSLANA